MTTGGGPAATVGGAAPVGAPASVGAPPSSRGPARREAILVAAADLFSRSGYAAVGMDDIGAAAGVTGPAIYRHFDGKAAVLASVFDRIIDAVAPAEGRATAADPAERLRTLVALYAGGVADRRRLMAVFVREVHHLPLEHGARLRERQRALVHRWRDLLQAVHPDWSGERVRTTVHGVFGLLNAVGTFDSPLPDAELADQLAVLATAALELGPG